MNEHYRRVQTMAQDFGEIRGFADADKAALRHILGVVHLMAENLSAYSGQSVEAVMNAHAKAVCHIQEKTRHNQPPASGKG
jgi:hypothetical protein